LEYFVSVDALHMPRSDVALLIFAERHIHIGRFPVDTRIRLVKHFLTLAAEEFVGWVVIVISGTPEGR
jgi:hypothetical protein